MFNRLNPRLLSWVDKTVWFLCTARNAIVVIVCLVLAILLDPELQYQVEFPSRAKVAVKDAIIASLKGGRRHPIGLSGSEMEVQTA